MKVYVQAEIGAETLHHSDEARLYICVIKHSTALALRSKKFPVPNAKDLAQEIFRQCAAKAQSNRQRQDPLPNASFGHDAIDEVDGKHRHSPTRARRAKATSFARERNNAIGPAMAAPDSAKSIAQDAAA
jgi:hypothetical protein